MAYPVKEFPPVVRVLVEDCANILDELGLDCGGPPDRRNPQCFFPDLTEKGSLLAYCKTRLVSLNNHDAPLGIKNDVANSCFRRNDLLNLLLGFLLVHGDTGRSE